MKLILLRKFFLFCSGILLSIGAYAQVNIAANTNATFTASGGNTLYGITRINNGHINPCGFQDCWIPGGSGGTNNWMVCTFNQAEDVNAIRIWVAEKDRRYLSGGTVQVWSGGAWVDHHRFENPYDDVNGNANPCDYMVTFPRVNTDRVRITKWIVSGAGFNQATNPDFREIEMYNLKGHDVGATSILPLFESGNKPVLSNIRNIGNNEVDSFNLEWSVNGVFQSSTQIIPGSKLFYKDTLKMFRDTVLNVGLYNFVANTSYDVKVWTSLPNGMVDSVQLNDTALFTFVAVGKPAPPLVEDQVYCGISKPLLKGKGAPLSEINWYADPLGTQFVGTGDSIQLTSDYYPTDTIPFYGRSAITFKLSHEMAPMGGLWSFAGGASPQDKGVYLNITPKYDMLLDSMDIGFTAPNVGTAGPHTVEVYIKTGTHNGFETNAAAWTLAGTSTTTLAVTPLYNNRLTPARISGGRTVLKANTQYALYVMIKDVNAAVRTNCGAGSVQSNQTKFENETFIMEEGALSAGTFGANGVAQGYVPNIHFFYELFLESDSAIATIYVHPKPVGASIDGKTGSKGTFVAGTKANPDYVTNSETIEYEFAPPTGYANVDFGSTWTISTFTIETESGTPIDMADTTATPPGANPGYLAITPRITEVDSLFKITMIISDLGPYNCDSVVERWLYVAPRPFANILPPVTSCDGDGLFFDNKSTQTSGFMTHKWYFKDINDVLLDSSDAFNPVYTFPTYGSFKVSLISTNAQYGYSDDTTIIVVVGEIPTIDIKAVNACEGIAVSFINNTSASTATPTFIWDFGDGSPTSTIKSPTHLYASPGGYQVKLIASAGGCSSEKVINAYQFAKPVSGYTFPSGQICSGIEVKFINTTTIASGAAGAFWDFKDVNEISTDLSPSYAFSTGGTFDVKLKSVSEFGCQDSTTQTVNINLAPKAAYMADKFCSREATQFTNQTQDAGSGYGVVWDFGDGSLSSLENPSHNWLSEGEKTVKLTITSANGCKDAETKSVKVLPQAIANFNVNDACSGQEISFENTTDSIIGNATYSWIFGDGGVSTAGSPKHVYNVTISTSLNVSLTANLTGGCPSTITKPINIEPSPTCGFTWRDTFISPQGRGIYFEAASQPGAVYNWVMGDVGPGPKQAAFFYQFPYFKPYNISLGIQNSAGCECKSASTVQFSPTGVKGIEEIGVVVYPNPTKDMVKVEGKSIQSITIYNAEGKAVYTTNTIEYTNTIDLSQYATGVYQVEIVSLKGKSTVKLIKH